MQSHLFLMSQIFEMLGCQWHKVKQIKFMFADKTNSGTWFGAPLYYLPVKWFSFLQ